MHMIHLIEFQIQAIKYRGVIVERCVKITIVTLKQFPKLKCIYCYIHSVISLYLIFNQIVACIPKPSFFFRRIQTSILAFVNGKNKPITHGLVQVILNRRKISSLHQLVSGFLLMLIKKLSHCELRMVVVPVTSLNDSLFAVI